MNNFIRTRSSKVSLKLGINYLINKIDNIRIIYFNKPEIGKIKRSRHRTIRWDALENFNFLYNDKDNLLSKMLKLIIYANTGRYENIQIFFRNDEYIPSFDKQEIELIKKYMDKNILESAGVIIYLN